MNLREVLLQVEDLSDELVIFASRDSEWALDSVAALVLLSDMDEIGTDLEDLDYFLEVEIAKDVLTVWSSWRDGRKPTEGERIEAILYYVNNDAYLE